METQGRGKGQLHVERAMSGLQAPSSPLFRYTSGRWVYDEHVRRKERERVFNVDQLRRLAAAAVSRASDDVIGIDKLGEGAANRAFVIHFRDGFKLVARIPYPSIEPTGLLVASEAATMTFLRTKGIPVPKIFDYASSSDNSAGTEYIFMEFCCGANLGDVWDEVGEETSTRLIRSLANMEQRLAKINLPASGSLFFLRDLPEDCTGIPVEICETNKSESIYLGPSVSPQFWFGRRGSMKVDRGPFSSPQGVMDAGAVKEIQFLEQYGRPLLPFNRFQRETFKFQKQQPAVHLDSLQKYLQISRYLIPKSGVIRAPTLRHPDLRPSNLFINDDYEITALIDWQHSAALPMFLSCGIPEFLMSWSASTHQTEPSTSSLHKCGNEKTQKDASFRQRQRQDTYVSLTERHDMTHFEALIYPFSVGRQKIHRLASDPWQGDNVPLRSSLIFVKQNWLQISSEPDAPCPISFPDEEEREILRLDDVEQQGVEQLEEFKSTLGLGPEGWVSHENYDDAKAAIARMKEMSLELAESEEEVVAIRDHWVFDDMDEDEYL